MNIDTTDGTGAALDTLSDNTSWAARARSAATEAPAFLVEGSVLHSPTVAPLRIGQSTASGAVIEIAGVFISTASMLLAANQTAFHIPVYHQSEGVLGYIPVSKGVS